MTRARTRQSKLSRAGAEVQPETLGRTASGGETASDRLTRAGFPSTLALTALLTLASVGLLMGVVLSVVEPRVVATFAQGSVLTARQGAETFLFGAAFFVILPVALLVGPRLTNAIAAGPNLRALPSLVLLLVSALAAAVVLVRLAQAVGWTDRSAALTAAMIGWWALAVAVLLRASRIGPWPLALRLSSLTPLLWISAAASTLAALFTVTHVGSLSPIPLALGAGTIPLVLLVFARRHPPRLRAGWGVAVDVAISALVLLAIGDLVFMTVGEADASYLDSLKDHTMVFHQTFLLGPANQVLGGDAMLVESSSQYGVGSIYFLAAWFKLAPIGYGTFALLDSALTALYFLAGYALLRICAASRLLAGAAMAVAIVTMTFSLVYPVGGLVQEGPFRFGLPLVLILAVVVGQRWRRLAQAGRITTFAVVGVSSVWAMEAFALTLATFAAMASFEAYLLQGDRGRWLLRQAAFAVVSCLAAHGLFAAATLIFAGELPDWQQYLAFLEGFLFGNLGDITYDFAAWSPALAVGSGYLISAAAVVLLARMRPAVAHRERISLLAITGTTTYGIVFYAYFVNRSAAHVLAYCCLPILLAGVLWIDVLRRSDRGLPGRPTIAALGAALTLAVVLVTVAWPSIGAGFERSALAHALPGGDSPRAAFDRLWSFPPFYEGADEGKRLLDRFMPGERRTAVLVTPGLDTEILMRSGRSNRLPLGAAVGESFVADTKFPVLREAIRDLRPGDRMLLDRDQVASLTAVRRNPRSRALSEFAAIGAATTPLQVRMLVMLDERFRMRRLYSGDDGFVVVELDARR